jgi:RNase P/RNase MRP subunit p30
MKSMFIDIAVPKDNEQAFIEIAEKLGCSGLVFLYAKEDKRIKERIKDLSKSTKMKLYTGLLVKDANKARKAKKDFDLLFGLGTRQNFESRDIDVLFDLESGPRQDYIHNRNSGLNQVHCKLAKEKKKTLAFSFNQVLKTEHPEIIIGRLMQNLALCKKYKNDFVIASFAREPYEMRFHKDYVAFLKAVGAHNKQAKEAVEILDRFFL